ncbi:MAG: hypothetical protein IAG10_15630 [Planctomycetaceae bacterium]|nr:hypothetical protein [Planctomycetaceae bacterium]
MAAIVILGLLVAACGWFDRKFLAPRRHDKAVEQLIGSLAQRRPPDVTRGQWASAVAWTWNLHGNSLLFIEADAPTIAAFEQRLRDRLAGKVDMETIDWIWNEYARLCPHGASFQRFKQRMQEEIETVGPDDDPWGMKVP